MDEPSQAAEEAGEDELADQGSTTVRGFHLVLPGIGKQEVVVDVPADRRTILAIFALLCATVVTCVYLLVVRAPERNVEALGDWFKPSSTSSVSLRPSGCPPCPPCPMTICEPAKRPSAALELKLAP